jgi:teichuronic acid biosynthesis glycosyltransferase TuaC
MKVLIISHMYPSSFNKVSGIFVHELAKALVKQNIEVRVVSPVPWSSFPINYFSSKWMAYSKIPYYTEIEGIQVYYPRYLVLPHSMLFFSSGSRMYKGIKRTIEEIYNNFKFDLIHANVALPDGYAAMKLSKMYRKPFLVTIHGQDAYTTIKRDRRCRSNVELVLKNSQKVVVVSSRLKDILLEQIGLWLADKLEVVGNGVNIEAVIDIEPNNRLEPYLLTVGYLIERKAHKYVIQAFARLTKKYPALKYVIIGDGPERKNLSDLVKKLGLQSKVRFLGIRSHKEVFLYMKKCRVFVLPSWDEAFGVVYVEAMANGKPVIGCKGEGIDGIILNGYNGILVKPRDVDSLVKALDFLLSHPEEANIMGERARKLVLENYTWEKNAEKTIEIYKEVLERG